MKTKELKELVKQAHQLRNQLNPPVQLPPKTRELLSAKYGSIKNAAEHCGLTEHMIFNHLYAGHAPSKYREEYTILFKGLTDDSYPDANNNLQDQTN